MPIEMLAGRASSSASEIGRRAAAKDLEMRSDFAN